MPDCVILNPHAGSADDVEALSDRLSGMGLEICRSDSAEEAADIAENAARGGSKRIFSAGGDGSTNAVINGLLRVADHDTAFGILPAGTGNDFARTLGVPLDIAAVRVSESKLEFAGLAARIAGGQLGGDYTNSPLVHQWKVQRLSFHSTPAIPITLDGNAYEATDFSVEILPGALQVLAPPALTDV